MKLNALVTGTGSLIGQAIIKSIVNNEIRNKIRLLGCDYFNETVGSYWCDENFLLPDLLKESEIDNWKQAIKKIIEENNVKIVFVGVDFELQYFADMKDSLFKQYGCTVVVSDRDVIDIGNDKYNTYEFLVNNGFNAPKTILLEDMKLGMLQYPFILKPRVGARSRGVEIINCESEFIKKYELYYNQKYIAQEKIGTKDSEYTCGVIFLDGVVDSICLKRNLKEGNTSVAEYQGENETLVSYVEKIASALTPYGSCNFQLRTDENGIPYLFEINPRFSGTTYMRSLFGYNEVEYIICKILGWKTPELCKKKGKVIRYFEERLVHRT